MREGWINISLGQAADYYNGRAFKPKEWKKKGLPIIRIQNLNKPEAAYNYTDQDYESRYKVQQGDLLYAWSASLGVFIWKGGNAWLNQHIFRVDPKKFIDKAFLFHTLDKITVELYAKAHGSGMVHVTKGKFTSTVIPLPPLPEQRAIVAKIEQLFSELDNGIANLKTAQEQLKVYRQAVLKKAFEGEFTRNSISKNDIPKDWVWNKVGKVGEVTGGLTKNSKREQLEKQLPYLRVANVYANKLDLSEIKTIGIKEQELERVLLRKNDLLVVEGNGSPDQIGRVALWKGTIDPCVHQNHLIKLRFKENIQPLYVLYWLLSPKGRELIKLVSSSTSGLYTLSLSKVKNLSIPICGMEEQNQIVQEIESRLSVCDKIEESIIESLDKAEALRQSILKKAFEGKLLTEAELAACRKEPDWEPAEKLLERMKGSKLLNKVQ